MRVILVLFFALTAPLWASVSIEKISGQQTYSIHLEGVGHELTTVEGQSFLKPVLLGHDGYEGILFDEGLPQLPVLRFQVVAESEKDILVTWGQEKSNPKSLKGNILPALQSLEKVPNAVRKMIVRTFQKSVGVWPKNFYDIKPAGSIAGKSQWIMTLYPYQFYPQTNSYLLTSEFKIVTQESEEKNLEASRELLPPAMAFVVGKTFQNSETLSQYKSLKEKLGMKVFQINVGPGVSSPDEIRAALQKLYRTANLKFALIVGDSEDVSALDSTYITGLTDHYYRSIDTDNYKADINGPDIGVGRLTVQTNAQLDAVLKKFMKYMKGEFKETKWLNELSFIATDDRYEIAEGSHNYAIQHYTAPFGYQGVFPKNPMLGGDQLYAITHQVSDSDVVRTIKLGRFIINYSGHGSTTSWAGPNVGQHDVTAIKHEDALPFVISNACITAQYTIDESFGETWLRHPQGAILYWGSMDSSYWDEDDILEKAMYKSIYEDGLLTFNDLTNYGLGAVYRHYGGQNRSNYYWETYTIFGDSSLFLRTKAPTKARFDLPSEIPFADENFEFTVTDSEGRNLKNLQIALTGTDASGRALSFPGVLQGDKVSFRLPVLSPLQELTLTYYGPNINYTEKKIRVARSTSAHILVKELKLNNVLKTFLRPQETAQLGLQLENVGVIGTAGGKIEIIKAEGPIQVLNAFASIPAINASGELFIQSPLQIKALDAVHGTKISLQLKWQINEGNSGIQKLEIDLEKANLNVLGLDFGNVNEPIFNGADPGSDGQLYLTLQNNGTEDLKNGELGLEEIGTNCLSFESPSVLTIAAGTTKRTSSINYSVRSDCRRGQKVVVNLTINYPSAYVQTSIKAQGSFNIGSLKRAFIGNQGVNVPIEDNKIVYVPFDFDGRITSLLKINVTVKLTHTYVSDITIKLTPPGAGTPITLLPRSSGTGQNNFERTWGHDGTMNDGLTGLVGTSAAGEWLLTIEDQAARDQGTLLKSDIEIIGY